MFHCFVKVFLVLVWKVMKHQKHVLFYKLQSMAVLLFLVLGQTP